MVFGVSRSDSEGGKEQKCKTVNWYHPRCTSVNVYSVIAGQQLWPNRGGAESVYADDIFFVTGNQSFQLSVLIKKSAELKEFLYTCYK